MVGDTPPVVVLLLLPRGTPWGPFCDTSLARPGGPAIFPRRGGLDLTLPWVPPGVLVCVAQPRFAPGLLQYSLPPGESPRGAQRNTNRLRVLNIFLPRGNWGITNLPRFSVAFPPLRGFSPPPWWENSLPRLLLSLPPYSAPRGSPGLLLSSNPSCLLCARKCSGRPFP